MLNHSESGVVDVLVDAADAEGTGGSGDSDVAVLAPAIAPRVAHDVVLNAVLDTPAHSKDGVVAPLWAAISSGDNTARVVSEDVIAGGDSHVDGLLGECGQVGVSAAGLRVR